MRNTISTEHYQHLILVTLSHPCQEGIGTFTLQMRKQELEEDKEFTLSHDLVRWGRGGGGGWNPGLTTKPKLFTS